MKELKGKSVKLIQGECLRRERENRRYLMKLNSTQLLKNYLFEAGRNIESEEEEGMGGWEEPTCQLRGHFLGHWLSAAAIHYDETGDLELMAKAEWIVQELEICQKENGGEWVCAIPEKYLHWIGQGKAIWAPQYNIHKLFMGLIDVFRYMKIERALTIADKLADWFYQWSGTYSKEEFDDILDVETGGMMEIWCDLLQLTGDQKYKTLIQRYYRRRLFEPLLEGKDVLTNMHANTTIPEVLGCARAYELTGDRKWLDCVNAYWKCAVTDRGCYATGGQTQGEIWTPMQKLKARLGDKNQEHCTVYNMIRLAEFLFRQTKEPKYMHYIEYNVQNGIFAQAYFRGWFQHKKPEKGLLTYFLPMKAGSKKDWAGELDSFFCCHGTMVQANAALNRCLFYQDEDDLYITQYIDSEVCFRIGSSEVKLVQKQDMMNGSLQNSSENNALQTVNETAGAFANKPDFRKYLLTIQVEEEVDFTLNLRIPDWIMKSASVFINGKLMLETLDTDRFVKIRRLWKNGDQVAVLFPIGIKFIPLPDDETMGAFRYGADVLAGITEQERVLKLDGKRPEEELMSDIERQWGDFQTFYRTETQDPGINFKKINEIGNEPYQIYFKCIDIQQEGGRK